MRIWAFVSQKGGSGKTTMVLQLAIAAMLEGLAVLVLDLDPQRSAEQWSEFREDKLGTDEPVVVHGTPTDLSGMLEAARETDTDLVLIDTPPAVDRSMIYAASAGDIVVVPTKSNVLDQFSLRETLDYLDKIRALDKTVVTLNAPGKDKKARAETKAIAAEEFGAEILAVTLEDQAALASSLKQGRGVTETKRSPAAARAITDIYQRLCAFERGLAPTKPRKTP